MPKGSHHICAVTDDADSVLNFVVDVLGVEGRKNYTIPQGNLERALGWPAGSPGTRMSMVGSGNGKFEIITAPAGLDRNVPRGFVLASVAVRDIDASVARARAMGVVVSDPQTSGLGSEVWKAAFATVGGLTFELIQYSA